MFSFCCVFGLNHGAPPGKGRFESLLEVVRGLVAHIIFQSGNIKRTAIAKV